VIRASRFEIHSDLQDDSARLTLSGELDLATVPQVEEAVATVLARGARRLVVDLSAITFVDSSGLRLFIVLNDRAAAEGWTFALIRPSDRPLSVFQITGAEKNLPFIEEPSQP
jgi:anti-sigma B factor antagonist